MFVKLQTDNFVSLSKFTILSVLGLFVTMPVSLNAASTCSSPTEANDILKCLQDRHPEVVDKDKLKEVSEKLYNQGNAWKNPQVSFETTGGYNLGSSVFESEFRISQAIEFSGQRSARRKKGKAQGDIFLSDSMGKVEDVTLMGITNLYRLAQIQDEISKIEESIQRFKIINGQYSSRPRLNPEQEISQSLIQLAKSEFDFRLNQIVSEKNEILSELTAFTNFSPKDILSNLPNLKNAFQEPPTLDSTYTSSTILKSQAEVDFTKGALDEARAEAWPEFTVDVIAQNIIDGSLQYQMYGAGISLPLPIFQWNQGEKSLKAVEFSRATNIHAVNLSKQENVMKNLSFIYETSVKNLKNTPSNDSIERKHRKAEQLFSQGLISGPLIIETHKQVLEYTLTRHQEEIKAISALWKLYILKGNFLSQKI